VANAAVHNGERYAMLARQHAHRRTASKKVLHHLPGDVAGVGRHAVRGQAVVAREHHQLGLAQLGCRAVQDQAQAQCECLQAAQRAHGFGFVVQAGLELLSEVHGQAMSAWLSAWRSAACAAGGCTLSRQ